MGMSMAGHYPGCNGDVTAAVVVRDDIAGAEVVQVTCRDQLLIL